MSDATTTPEIPETEENIQTVAEAFTAKAREAVVALGEGVLSLTKLRIAVAVVIVDVRESIHVPRKSLYNLKKGATKDERTQYLKSAKLVTLPDWDGRSVVYRDWYNNTLIPMIEEHVPK